MKVLFFSIISLVFFNFYVLAEQCRDIFSQSKKTQSATNQTSVYLDQQFLQIQEISRNDLQKFTKDRYEYFKNTSVELASSILEFTPKSQNQIKRVSELVVTLADRSDTFYKIKKSLKHGIDKDNAYWWINKLIQEYKYLKQLTEIMVQAIGSIEQINKTADHLEDRNQQMSHLQKWIANSVQNVFYSQNTPITSNTQNVIDRFTNEIIKADEQTRRELVYFANHLSRLFEKNLIWEEGELQRKALMRSTKLNSATGKVVNQLIDQHMILIKNILLQSYDYITYHSHQTEDIKLVNRMHFSQTLDKVRENIQKEFLFSWSREDILRINSYSFKDTVRLELKRAVDRSQKDIVNIIYKNLKTQVNNQTNHLANNPANKKFYFKADQWKSLVVQVVKDATPIIQSLLAQAWQKATY